MKMKKINGPASIAAIAAQGKTGNTLQWQQMLNGGRAGN